MYVKKKSFNSIKNLRKKKINKKEEVKLIQLLIYLNKVEIETKKSSLKIYNLNTFV